MSCFGIPQQETEAEDYENLE